MKNNLKLAAQQPYYLPDYYFFYKISQADIFVIADFLKYRKQSSMNRASLGKGFKPGYLTVPVRHWGNATLPPISHVKLIDKKEWASRHLRTLSSLCRQFPFFEFFFPDLEKIYLKKHIYLGEFLVDLILWQTKIIFPGRKIYIASGIQIFSINELKHWIRRKFPEYKMYYYSYEYPYYEKHFNDRELMKLNNQNLIHLPSGYEPTMPVLMLLFMLGPEVILYFSDSPARPEGTV